MANIISELVFYLCGVFVHIRTCRKKKSDIRVETRVHTYEHVPDRMWIAFTSSVSWGKMRTKKISLCVYVCVCGLFTYVFKCLYIYISDFCMHGSLYACIYIYLCVRWMFACLPRDMFRHPFTNQCITDVVYIPTLSRLGTGWRITAPPNFLHRWRCYASADMAVKRPHQGGTNCALRT